MSSDAAERLVAGRWMLHTALRRGPAGVIWRASEPAGGRQLALEELRLPAWVDRPGRPLAGPGGDAGGEWGSFWAQVAAEARAAAALDHPGVVALEDVVVDDGSVYVAGELVDALTLDELVARHGPLPVRRVAQLGLELLDALEAGHAAGLAHLDLRPANVLVAADGRARLAGLGLATLRGDPRVSAERPTIAFLAPEQARGDPAGPATDLWSLGAVLFLAVEGETPFGGDGRDATRAAILGSRPREPLLAGPLAPTLTALLTKPTAGRPGIADTRRLLEPLAGTPRPVEPDRHPARPVPGPPEGDVSPRRAAASAGIHSPRDPRHLLQSFDLVQRLRRLLGNGVALDPVVRRVVLVAGGSVLLALVSFVVAVTVTGDPLGLRAQAVATTVAAPTTLAPAATAPPATAPPTTVAALVPPGWAVHTDPAIGYQVAVPPGWQVTGDGVAHTELRGQASPTVLRIDWLADPPADPVTVEQQAGAAHAGSRGGYQQARLEPAVFKGLPAALLEFTYQDGETWHALELGIRSPRHHIAVAIHAPDRDWGTGWALFEAFKASFVPPAT
jgi:eukaryotic-like serine/threonine-protein kinase